MNKILEETDPEKNFTEIDGEAALKEETLKVAPEEQKEPLIQQAQQTAPKPEIAKAVTPKTAAPQPEPKAPQDKQKDIALDEKGLLAPTTSSELWRMASMFLDSRALPKQFENTAQVFMAMQFLKSRGLDPNVAIRQTMIINGSINIWGDLPKAAVVQSGLCEWFEEFVFDKDYNPIKFENKNLGAEPYGAVCIIQRKDRPRVSKSFTVPEAKAAGLMEKSFYKQYLRRMLTMRARSLALKDEFPDVLSGVAIMEHDQNVDYETGKPQEKEVLADQLNNDYLEAKEVSGGNEVPSVREGAS